MPIVLNDTSPILFFMADDTDATGQTPKTGLTPTVEISKAGGSFNPAGGAVAEISGGWYKLTPTSVDTGTLGDLGIDASASGAFNWRDKDRVVPDVYGKLTGATTEPTAKPASTADPISKINWMFAKLANKKLMANTDGIQHLRNDGDTADIGTSAVTDDGTTTTEAKWS